MSSFHSKSAIANQCQFCFKVHLYACTLPDYLKPIKSASYFLLMQHFTFYCNSAEEKLKKYIIFSQEQFNGQYDILALFHTERNFEDLCRSILPGTEFVAELHRKMHIPESLDFNSQWICLLNALCDVCCYLHDLYTKPMKRKDFQILKPIQF